MLEQYGINLYELNVLTITVRIFLAVVLGGLIGTERDFKNRAAGIRTHMLVCLGASVVMMTNQYVVLSFPELDIDITRMGAQVVSGIGFLGAGTILVTKENQIEGLTTAAGLWASATLGLAIGIGFYEVALVGFIVIASSVFLLKPFKEYIQDKKFHRRVTFYLHLTSTLDELLEFTSVEEIKIVNINIMSDDKQRKNTEMIVKMTIELDVETQKETVFDSIRALDSVSHLIEVNN